MRWYRATSIHSQEPRLTPLGHYPCCVRCSKVDLICDGVPARPEWIVYQLSSEDNGTHRRTSRHTTDPPLVMTTCYSHETSSLAVRPPRQSLTDGTIGVASEMAATSTTLVPRTEVRNDGPQPQSFGNVVAEIPIDPALSGIQLPSGQFNPFDSYPPLESSEGVDQIIRYGE